MAFALGIAMLMGGAISQQTWLGILGFVVMLASATFGLASWRGRHAPAQQQPQGSEDQLFDFDDSSRRFDVIEGVAPVVGAASAAPVERSKPARRPIRKPGGKQGTFMQRMEQRWERRRHEGY